MKRFLLGLIALFLLASGAAISAGLWTTTADTQSATFTTTGCGSWVFQQTDCKDPLGSSSSRGGSLM